jgi:plastocyanin
MANGMMTTLWYDGHQPSGPVGDFVDDGPGSDVAGGHEHRHDDNPAAAGSVPADPSTPTPPAAATAETETRPAIAEGAVEIAMVDDRFAPPDLVVTAGTTVTWVNRGADWHSVAAFDGSFASDQVAPGQTFSHTFTTPGTYKFLCRHHGRQGMVGQIVVTE